MCDEDLQKLMVGVGSETANTNDDEKGLCGNVESNENFSGSFYIYLR